SAGAPDWTKVAFNGGPFQIWVDILERAGAEGSLRTLLEYIAGEAKASKTLATFIKALLEAENVPADPSPGDKTGPDFPSDVTREEALLFGEYLSESVGGIPDLLAGSEKVMRWRSSVCHLRVTASNGSLWGGTGTLLTGDRVLTNHHVLFPKGQKATAVAAQFNYESDAAGQMLASIVVVGDVTTIKSDAPDDWAVITVPSPAGAIALDLAANVAAAKVTQRALILEHPGGKPKRLAFVRNRISSVADRRVYYLTDTEEGSSGSPVFDTQGQMIAIHRAGGTPQKLIGVDTVKKNEGVRTDVIAPNVLNA